MHIFDLVNFLVMYLREPVIYVDQKILSRKFTNICIIPQKVEVIQVAPTVE